MQKEADFNNECWYKIGCRYSDLYPDIPNYPQCKNSCNLYKEMNYMIMNCGESNSYRFLIKLEPQECDIDAFRQLDEIKDNIEKFVNEGHNLFIDSINARSSKTTWSLKLMYKYFDEVWSGNNQRTRGYYIHVPTFMIDITSYDFLNANEFKYIDKILKTVDIVIWDDFIQDYTPEQQNKLCAYINRRFGSGKSNIFNGGQLKILKT